MAATLEEHGIIDGSTVNIVIEPEKEIRLTIMKLGPLGFTYKVMNSVRVRELKQQLIDGGSVGFSINDFQLFWKMNPFHCGCMESGIMLH